MPVRSLSSSVLRWPDRRTVHDAFARWVERAAAASELCRAGWDLTPLPVPVDVVVYTRAEWEDVLARDDRFSRMLSADAVWLLER